MDIFKILDVNKIEIKYLIYFALYDGYDACKNCMNCEENIIGLYRVHTLWMDLKVLILKIIIKLIDSTYYTTGLRNRQIIKFDFL